MQAALANRVGARSQLQALAQIHSRIAWAPAVLSGIVLAAFGLLIYVVMTDNHLTPLADVLLGSLAAMATQVANYWFGSLSSSAAKSEQIIALIPTRESFDSPGDF